MFKVGEHSCGDCKLKCIDCNAQICPKCLVECPVGNRCKSCAQRFTSHVLQIDFWTILRSFGAAFVAGILFSLLYMFLPLGGLLLWLLMYCLGSFTGNILFKISGRKLGPKMGITVAAGLLIGGFCLHSISLSLIIFILGAIGPFLGWGNPFGGIFRR